MPMSEMWFAHKKYRVVVCLDMSESMSTERWWGMPAHYVVDATIKYIQVCALLLRLCFVFVFGLVANGYMLQRGKGEGLL